LSPSTLVTGASGQDAGIIIYKLLGHDKSVVAVGRGENPLPAISNSNFTYVRLTEKYFKNPKSLLRKYGVETVFHLAAISSPSKCEADPKSALEVNYNWTGRLLEASERNNSKFIFASSGLIYPDSRNSGIINEETIPDPVGVYALSKNLATQLVAKQRTAGSWSCSAILFNHEAWWGPNLNLFDEMIDKICDFILSETNIEFYNAYDIRNWSNAEGIMDALVRLSELEVPSDYILGSDESFSILEVVVGILEELGYENVRISSKIKSPNRVSFVDNSFSKRILGEYLIDNIIDVGVRAVRFRLGGVK
jgi:nucleoside-diphosphate-sugar epimerase